MIGRRRAVMLAAIVAAAVIVTVGSVSAASARSARLLPIYSVENSRREVSLTFDAAWGDSDTDGIIAILKKYNVKATFFAVGSWVDKYPESVKKLHAAGHSIMNHSDSHPHINKLSGAEVVADAERCNDKIEALTGVRPIFYRAPYGEYNNDNVAAITDAGMYFVQWSADSIDWKKEYSPERLLQNVLKQISSGGIILCHNDAEHTLEELPLIIERLTADGYKFVPLTELIMTDNYYIDSTGRQRQAK